MTRRLKASLGSLLLLDRDGTLVYEADYPKDPKRVKFFPGVPAALRKLKKAGFTIAVVTNQSGVGRGIITWKQMRAVNARFLRLLALEKSPVDGLYWCPHHPKDRCACRKPKLGMVKQASRKLGVSWKRSISVGDRWSDVELGQKTGGIGILVKTGYGRDHTTASHGVKPDHTAKTFVQAARWIVSQTKGHSK